ncbi:hypothetical protein TWF481_002026 [Arthrobotrys musiformis]|uniref:Spherulin-4 n=1 Tax=Arthrobotrys musiformis TaxID=47236 RepID=A0AAV9VUW1_9PEZI
MAASPISSIHDKRENQQRDPRAVEKDHFSFMLKPQGNWVPEKCYYGRNPTHLRKDSDLIQSGACPEEINGQLSYHRCQNCSSCGRLRRLNYGLSGFIGVIVLLLGYFLFHTAGVDAQHRAGISNSLPKEGNLHMSIFQEQRSTLHERAVSSDQTNIIIPAYFGPEDAASWGKVISSISKFHKVLGFTIIINPSNGPGTTDEVARYSTLIETLAKYSNVNIIGYVHQSWGERDISSDVNTWISYFPGKLDGFFLDEMPSIKSTSNLSAVSSNNAFIRNKSKSDFRNNRSPLIVQNPGTEVDSSFYSLSPTQDVTIILENKDDYLSECASLDRGSANQAPSSLGMILLSVTDSEMESAVKTMLSYARYIFATGYDEDVAYTGVASTWGTFVSAAYKYGGTGSSQKITTTARVTTTKKATATKTKSKAKGSSSRSTKRRFPTTAARRKQTSSGS